MEKTLGQVAYETLEAKCYTTSEKAWQAVADAVVAEHERRKWQPIATAPQKTRGFVGKWRRGEWVWKETSHIDVALEDGYTHWQPLPPAPEVEG